MRYKSILCTADELVDSLNRSDTEGYEPVFAPIQIQQDGGHFLYVLLRIKKGESPSVPTS